MVLRDLAPILGIHLRFIGSDGTEVTSSPLTIPPALDDNVSLAVERTLQKKAQARALQRARAKRSTRKRGALHPKTVSKVSALEDDTQDTTGSLTYAPIEILDADMEIVSEDTMMDSTFAPVMDITDVTDQYDVNDIDEEVYEEDLHIDLERDLITEDNGLEFDSDDENPDDVPLRLLCSI